MLDMRIVLVFLLPLLGFGQFSDPKSKVLMFDFDEVVHYKYSLDQKLPSWDAKTKLFKNSKANKLRDLLYKESPITLADTTSIIQDLEKSQFISSIIPQNKMDSMHEALSVKQTDTIALPSRCLPIFRDILVLQNKGETVCILKLCFKCRHAHFIGIEYPATQYFGQHNEWKILKILLNYEREPTLWEIYGE